MDSMPNFHAHTLQIEENDEHGELSRISVVWNYVDAGVEK